ncbi:MAG: pyridoxal-phosphate dependent enzyme [Acidobacteria bacterium]|nr:pyridoxal-phosphate dependent enzyme [Acidobacteriota bacterium]
MVTGKQIQEAAARIAPIAHVTPVFTSRTFNARSGIPTYFKCENLQVGGAFKIRGAANFLFSMSKADLARGVVAYSSGNHAQAVAIAARYLDVPATIIMPLDAPKSKVEATRGYGAAILTYDRFSESREVIGQRVATETGATVVPPYDHEWILAGQGTAAKELLDAYPNLDAVIAPVSGGGLLAGCSIAAKHASASIRVFGAEPARANDTYLSLEAGRRVSIPPPDTIADGLRAPQPGEVTFPILQQNIEQMLLVSEEEILETVRFFATRMKLVVEPSGAGAAAAVLFRKVPGDPRSIGVIVSGGNVDLELLASL